MTRHFKKILKTCGIRDLHFHTLRHTFATRCVESGMQIKALSEMLGHSTVKIWRDCLRKEDSKISFLLIYAIGFYLEPKKQDIWKIFLFTIYPYFYCLVFLTSFFFSRSSYNVLLYSLGETLYFSLNTRLKVLWLSNPLSSQIVVIGSLVVPNRCFA